MEVTRPVEPAGTAPTQPQPSEVPPRDPPLLKPDVEVMEERIAPLARLIYNRCETILQLDAESLEERIAPLYVSGGNGIFF